MRRPWLLILAPVLVTVLIAGVVGGFIVVQSQQQAEQVQRADDVAADYLSEVDTFRARVLEALEKADQDSPAAQRTALRAAVAEPPRLGDADPFGMDESSAYARAEQVQAGLLAPYEEVIDELGDASVALAYVKVARAVLDMRVTDYLSTTTLSSSTEVRSSLIPAFVDARQRLDAATVPPGQDDLHATVRGAVQYVIDQASRLADNIDSGRGYSFTYADQFQEAITAVEDYATQVTGDLTESLNGLRDL
jgi:hypothetical protein